MTDKNYFWNNAAKDGLMLGAVSVIYFVLVFLCGKINAGNVISIALNVFTTLLWVAKLWVSLYMLRHFILRHQKKDEGEVQASPFRYGAAVSLLSALVYSGLHFAFITFVTPDVFTESVSLITESGMFSINEMEMLENMAPSMPLFSFIGNLMYCTLFGVIASFIFTRSTQNPF